MPSRGFTLVEMLAVMTVVAILLTLVIPAFVKIGSANNLAKGIYDIAGQLEQARAYAKANNTYTWVGFYEAAAQNSVGLPIGHVVVSVVASKDGTALYTSDPTKFSNGQNLVQIGKLTSIDNIHLTVLDNNKVTTRTLEPDKNGNLVNVPTAYQVGVIDSDSSSPPDSSGGDFSMFGGQTNQVTFNYPLLAATQTTAPSASGTPVYTFRKIIQFNALGDATKIQDSPQRLMEIGLRPTRGTTLDTASKNLAAIQVGGIGGAIRIYRQ